MDGSGEGARESWEQAAQLLWAWALRDGLGLQPEPGWSSCPCSQGGGGGPQRALSRASATATALQRVPAAPSRLADALGLVNGFPSHALKTTVTPSPLRPRLCPGWGSGGGPFRHSVPAQGRVLGADAGAHGAGVRPSHVFLCGPSGLVCRGVSPRFFRAIAVCRCGVGVFPGGGEPRVFRCRHLGPEARFRPLYNVIGPLGSSLVFSVNRIYLQFQFLLLQTKSSPKLAAESQYFVFL